MYSVETQRVMSLSGEIKQTSIDDEQGSTPPLAPAQNPTLLASQCNLIHCVSESSDQITFSSKSAFTSSKDTAQGRSAPPSVSYSQGLHGYTEETGTPAQLAPPLPPSTFCAANKCTIRHSPPLRMLMSCYISLLVSIEAH